MFLKMKTKNIMRKNCADMKNGYIETINNGLRAVRAFKGEISHTKGPLDEKIKKLSEEIDKSDAIVIGAGSGLSTSAGFTYTGKRLQKYFKDFVEKYNIPDMYSGGFMMMELDPQINWAYWARYIYINRYIKTPKPVYDKLYDIVKDKDYFVITTNVDHQFQMSGFDKNRLFYTQGDYGLFQTLDGENKKTYDNKDWVMKAMEAQGFIKDKDGIFQIPSDGNIKMSIPTELIPKSPGGKDVKMNLRADDSFVEDRGWHLASDRYYEFLKNHEDKNMLYLELGVGSNTPVIIKYPFWQMTYENENATYVCLNYNEAFCPIEIENRSICIEKDIGEVLDIIRDIY